MKYVPKAVTRLAYRGALKLQKHGPTILVVGGVVGFGASTVMAVKATHKAQPILDDHRENLGAVGVIPKKGTVVEEERVAIARDTLRVYGSTGRRLIRVYAPTITMATLSAAAILSGHNMLNARHVATLAAYSGLSEQFNSYRKRISDTLGEKAETDIYNGARGEWVEDENHKGEYKLQPKFDDDFDQARNYLRPWYDETNVHWSRDNETNMFFLKGVQSHMNNLLSIRGHVFLNEVLDALRLPRCREGAVMGWLYNADNGDGYIDFGFLTGTDPNTVAFRNGVEKVVRLNFNVDDEPIFMKI